jgi:hypothetical protein
MVARLWQLVLQLGVATALLAVGLGADAAWEVPVSQAASLRVSPDDAPLNPTYVDAQLGFRLPLAKGWRVARESDAPGPARALTLVDARYPTDRIQIAILHGPAMAAAFARRGKPAAHIGAYPAAIADTAAQPSQVPCLIRIFLAQQDYVVAEWCGTDAWAHRAQFAQLLVRYQPAPTDSATIPSPVASPSETPVATATPEAPTATATPTATGTSEAPTATLTLRTAASPFASLETCAQVMQEHGYNAASATWGRVLATPTATSPALGWDQYNPGAYICSNTGSPDRYLFQCTELANRFISEQWGLPSFTVDAQYFYDYYQNGVYQPGQVRALFPAGSYQLSNDASQGPSAFAPQPGDLLVFQDVNDAQVGWTSGIRPGTTGHVAVVTGTDATHVYIAQQNYNDTEYFQALPLRRVANGYEITDLSHVSNRIVRGWIHFTADSR